MSAALKQGIWTPEKRLEQSRALRGRQIWLKSTGPRTPQGKLKSSMNARKDGYEQRQAEKAEMRKIKHYLRLQKLFTDILRLQTNKGHLLSLHQQIMLEHQLNFLENELSILGWEFWNDAVYSPNIIPFPGAPP